jgi:hypothetical protein
MVSTWPCNLPKIRDVGQADEATSLTGLLFDLRTRSACWREIPCRGESLKTNQLSEFRGKGSSRPLLYHAKDSARKRRRIYPIDLAPPHATSGRCTLLTIATLVSPTMLI